MQKLFRDRKSTRLNFSISSHSLQYAVPIFRGLYVTGDPGAEDAEAKEGTLKIRFGLGFAKAHTFVTGQTPVMKYHRDLMQAILSGKAQIAKAVNAKVIS